MHTRLPSPFPLPPFLPSPPRFPRSIGRGNLQALLTSAIIVLAARHRIFIFIFSSEIARSIIAVAKKYRNSTAPAVVFSTCASLTPLASRYPLPNSLIACPSFFVLPSPAHLSLRRPFHLTLDTDRMEFRETSNYATRSPSFCSSQNRRCSPSSSDRII